MECKKCHGMSKNVMECQKMSWNVKKCHGMLKKKSWNVKNVMKCQKNVMECKKCHGMSKNVMECKKNVHSMSLNVKKVKNVLKCHGM